MPGSLALNEEQTQKDSWWQHYAHPPPPSQVGF